MYKNYIKKILDFTIALLGIIVLSPIFITLIIVLFIANQGKPFFFQVRIGKKEKPFKIIKFRTMNELRNNNGDLLSDDKRLTKIGNFVRKTSLDELPQLFNVLKGDMSLIGPRPLLIEYLPFYNSEQKKRHQVNPGITGWAQVNGRNSISWHEKFNFDIYYVNNISLLLDIKIIIMTLKRVVTKRGIAAIGHATMPRFDELHKK